MWRTPLCLSVLALALSGAPGHAGQCPPNIFPGVNPASLTDPQAGLSNLYTFNNPILDSNSLQKYVTPVPNALAPAFIYSPNGTQGGETLYTVSMREITQSLGVVYNNPLDAANNGCTGTPNTLWAYGDARDNGVTAAPTAAHSVPGPTFEVTSNVPHRTIWTNELPNANPFYHPANIDPTLDCGPKAPGCAPFNRVVPHTHGAHVADDSDGNPDQWFTPGFARTGHNWQPNTHIPGAVTGTYRFDNSQEAATVWYHDHAMGLTHLNVFAGLAGFNIIRDANEIAMQTPPAGGGLATLPKYPFENLLAIQDRVFDTNGKVYSPDRPIQDLNFLLAGVACDPTLPTTATPPATVSPYACAPANLVGGVGSTLLPTTPCDPAAPIAPVASVYACPVKYFTRNPDFSLNIIPTGTTPPAGAQTFPSITSEYWGNVILVNGQVWPKQDVEKRVYRFRWLNGSDSRTYLLRLVDKNTGLQIAGLDIWQIGTEQGFLPKPVKVMINDPTATGSASSIVCPAGAPPETVVPTPAPPGMTAGQCFNQTNGIVLMPGERVDVLLDFTNVAAGTQVILQNLGPEFPFTGEYPPSAANGQLPSTIVPEIMLLNVVAASAAPNTMAPGSIVSLRAAPVPTLAPTATRTLYLAERVDQFGRLSLTINGVDYMTAIDQFIPLGATEEWDIVNLTPDGHPMHPHLVSHQVINRQDLIDPATNTPFAAPMNLPMMGTTVQAQFNGVAPNPAMPTATGAIYPPAANETGASKDTLFVPPGKVTRIKALFDIPGLYVFHCHILSHEENDMMRPFAVTTPAASVTLTAGNVSQPSGTAGPVVFTAAAKTGLTPYTDSNAYEYNFSVTGPPGVTLTQPDNMVYNAVTMMGIKSLNSALGYSMYREATWTPPKVPGTYAVTVKAVPMGADPTVAANVVASTLNYTIAAAGIAGATSTTGNGFYKAGSSINVTVTFSQAVTSTGLAIALNNGVTLNTGALASASSYSGSFTVAAGQNTPAGQSLNITGITGTIADAVGNTIINPAIPAGGNIADSVSIITDTTPPVSQATPPAGTYGGSVSVTLAANEAATIYFTTDGTTPTTASTIYTVPIVLSSTTTTTMTVKFFAVDKAGNTETAVNSVVYTLHTADLVAKVAINNGKAFTNSAAVTLAISASDPAGVAAYAVSTDNVTYSTPVVINPPVATYTANVPLTLPSTDGLKSVYVKFTDALGVVYPPVSAQITLDTVPPTTSATPAAGTYSGAVTVALAANEKATIYYTTNGTVPTISSPIYISPITLNDPGKSVQVQFYAVDQAGNAETVKSVTYNFTHAPDMTATVKINGGAQYTNTRNVTLSIRAQDPIGGGVATMSFSNDGVTFTTPVPYAATDSMPWTLSPGDALKTVYFRFTDLGGAGQAPNTYTFTDTIYLAEGVTTATCDLDGDGKVDIGDILKLLRASAAHLKLTIAEQARSDVSPLVNGKPSPKGRIDVGDALVCIKKYLKLIDF
ncbi:chitobiase/beta-hexosaminidase C-terminal domain-containing protein [Geobacter sp. FeAm09]|uniref:chitobiase/beta-hexosaminidase C-terminal domain-containing protein n=1 Tax=Geobacter sp. FeAm09 TaxID=2597769 RepID=UPI00143D5E6D|nr:chitobiase/beta-hexosaminidase C-terminal domain-containing protein [Geobacter sp. FeAm09]